MHCILFCSSLKPESIVAIKRNGNLGLETKFKKTKKRKSKYNRSKNKVLHNLGHNGSNDLLPPSVSNYSSVIIVCKHMEHMKETLVDLKSSKVSLILGSCFH